MYDSSVERGSDRTSHAFRQAIIAPSPGAHAIASRASRGATPGRASAFIASVFVTGLLGACESPPGTAMFPLADAATEEDTTVVIHDTGPDNTDSWVDGDTAPDVIEVDVADDVAPEIVEDVADDIEDTTEVVEDVLVSRCPSPCLNDGVCDETDGTCSCTDDYYGDTCEIAVVPCATPCQNGGTCLPVGVCECTPGWQGTACEVSSCFEAPCTNGGQCVGTNRCTCPTQWMGRQCQAPAPPMSLVTGAEFTMGSPAREVGREETFEEQILVKLTYSYAIATIEMRQGDWKTLFDGAIPDRQSFKDDDYAVTNFTWWSALALANALSANHGLEPCYEPPPDSGCTATTVDYRTGTVVCPDDVLPIIHAPGGDVLRCEGYRLPTEAEWEFAARAGSMGALHGPTPLSLNLLDNDLTCTPGSQPALSIIAWWCGSPTTHIEKVGTLNPNAWDLNDVLGNAAEWTWDGFNPKIAGGDDPHRDQMRPWTSATGNLQPAARTVRGGAWNSRSAADLRLAARRFVTPSTRDTGIGVRLVRTLP